MTERCVTPCVYVPIGVRRWPRFWRRQRWFACPYCDHRVRSDTYPREANDA